MNATDLDNRFSEAARAYRNKINPNEAFVLQLERELKQSHNRVTSKHRPFIFKPAWAAAMILLLIAATALAGFGPEKVFAQIQKLLGYIPGVGLVERTQLIRILKEPVSLTRDEMTVMVSDAVLTAEKTVVDYHIFNIKSQAEQNDPAESLCQQAPYLLLPDGRQLDFSGGQFGPIPPEFDTASFVLPCLAKGEAPGDWAIALTFVPAPDDYKIHEAIMLQPLPETTIVSDSEPEPEASAETEFVFTQVITTHDSYILYGVIQPITPNDTAIQIASVPVIRDADDTLISYSVDPALADGQFQPQPGGGISFVFGIPIAGTVFPVRLEIPVRVTAPGQLSDQQPMQIACASWQPEQAAQPVEAVSSSELTTCVSNDNLLSLGEHPDASALRTLAIGADGSLNLHDRSQGPITLAQASIASSTPDLSHIAWVSDSGLTVYSSADGKSVQFPNLNPEALSWSPDGRRLAAHVNPDFAERAIIDIASGETVLSTRLSQEQFAGWSTNGDTLYLLIPGSSGEGWLLMSYDLANDKYQEVAYLKHSSPKRPMAQISADGQWIGYHGDTQASLYLMPLAGGQAIKIIDVPVQMINPAAITSWAWSADSQSITVNLILPDQTEAQTTIVVNLRGCQAYTLPYQGQILGISQ